jgi:DNA polymerase-3 subunit gamma/tau
LATTEINKVPPTIISRTQRFDFKAYTAAELVSLLQKVTEAENFKASAEVLELIAQNAEGGARDALSLLDKVMSLGKNPGLEETQALLGITDIAVCERLLELVARGRAAELPDFFSSLLEKGADYAILNRDFLEYLRKILVFKVTEGKQSFNLAGGRELKIKELAGKFSLNEIIFIIRLFLKSYKDLPASPAPEIPMLLAAIEASLKKSPSAPESPAASFKAAAPLKREASIPAASKEGEDALPSLEKTFQPQIQETIVAEEIGEVMTMPEIRLIWPKVIEKIRIINSPLASLLRNGELLDVLGNKIILGVKFLFNKQNLENPKNFSLICAAFEQVTGKKMTLAAQVVKQEKAEVDSTEALSQALQVFGGELID